MTDWSAIAEATLLTLRVTIGATLIGAIIGIPIGSWLAGRGRGRRLVRAVVLALYALPPVVAGLVLYLLLAREGPLGPLGLLYTPTAILLAETLLTTPLIAGLTVAAIQEVPRDVREHLGSLAQDGWLVRLRLLLEARHGVASALVVAFGRALAEVGAALLAGGNIRDETRTIATAILEEVSRGAFQTALWLGALLLLLALASVLAIHRLEHRAAEVRRWA